MSDLTGVFKPKSFSIRDPLDDKRHHGQIINPPRMSRLGGMDQLKEPHGHFKNDMNLQKPGTGKSSIKK
jgi:hypothetical protein